MCGHTYDSHTSYAFVNNNNKKYQKNNDLKIIFAHRTGRRSAADFADIITEIAHVSSGMPASYEIVARSRVRLRLRLRGRKTTRKMIY